MNKIQLISNHLSASAPPSNENPILVESQGHYTDIVLNRPKKMNSVTPAMAQKFQALIREFNQNPNTKTVFFRKAGGPAFCAGGDLNAITESKKNGGSEFTYQHQINTVVHLMSQAKPTTIAFLDGIVMGTGVGLSYFAKIKIATENTLLAMPESKLGYFTDVGSGWFLPRLENGVGLYMMMTGEGVRGEDLVRVGLAHYFVESKKLEELLRELKEFTNKSKAEDVSEKALRSIVEKYSKRVEGRFSLEGLTKEHFEGKKSAEEVFKSLKAKAEQDPKVKKVLELLSKNSPLGVKINFELHKRGKTMTVKDILNLELGIEDAVSATGEILRGVQRVLLKKDVPWSNESISEVKESEINELFQVSKTARLLD